jgi:hypothetical protein
LSETKSGASLAVARISLVLNPGYAPLVDVKLNELRNDKAG